VGRVPLIGPEGQGAGIRRVSVRVSADRAEEARAVMLELFPEGFEEVDVQGELELAAYTTAAGEERLWHVFGTAATSDVPAGWAEAWKQFHRPTRVGRLWVGPPWEKPPSDLLAVVIDPGRAFGTGSHPTTRLSLGLLLGLAPASIVDLGCGSGVLAIAAARLGFEPVIAMDIEEDAVSATRANAAVNGVQVEVRHGDVLRDDLPTTAVAVANITVADAQALAARVRSGTLITSGYLASEQLDFSGWQQANRCEANGWAADLLTRV
jgi:ribosomal protein L11 methyltransferase